MSKSIEKKTQLLGDIQQLIEESRNRIAIEVNSTITMLYWQIGTRINKELLKDKRAEYGKQIVNSLSAQLTLEYGSGWSEKHLRHCLRFAETFPDETIVSTLWRQLSWSHLKELIYFDDVLKREFYIEMCKLEKWSVRTFRERVSSMLYERTAISRKPEETIKHDIQQLNEKNQLTPDLVFRDPYILDFLGLKDTYSERDLEAAIIAELLHFIIELGSDFAFLARQKRITIDNDDYYIDLLFYHRRLKCLVAIDLKLGKFEAAFKGQMELYLRWLEKYEMTKEENLPIGLILCASKNEEHIELLQMDKSNIKVAEYLTKLPDMKLLETKLHQAIEKARLQLSQRDSYE
jgi:predicted nuclease of restriction endonuclease-like (RecB) superfamily